HDTISGCKADCVQNRAQHLGYRGRRPTWARCAPARAASRTLDGPQRTGHVLIADDAIAPRPGLAEIDQRATAILSLLTAARVQPTLRLPLCFSLGSARASAALHSAPVSLPLPSS